MMMLRYYNTKGNTRNSTKQTTTVCVYQCIKNFKFCKTQIAYLSPSLDLRCQLIKNHNIKA